MTRGSPTGSPIRGRASSANTRSRSGAGCPTPARPASSTASRSAATRHRAAAVAIRKASNRETHLLVTLTEGRNREIRRWCESVGHEVDPRAPYPHRRPRAGRSGRRPVADYLRRNDETRISRVILTDGRSQPAACRSAAGERSWRICVRHVRLTTFAVALAAAVWMAMPPVSARQAVPGAPSGLSYVVGPGGSLQLLWTHATGPFTHYRHRGRRRPRAGRLSWSCRHRVSPIPIRSRSCPSGSVRSAPAASARATTTCGSAGPTPPRS